MQKFKNAVRMCLMYAAVVLLAGGYPMAAMADTVDSTPPATTTTPTDPAAPPAPDPEKYTFNSETKHWDSNKWVFNPVTSKYEAVAPPPVITAQPSTTPNAGTPSTGAGHPDTSTTSTSKSDTNATIDNNINSNAATGDATIKQNTTAGNATSGNAAAVSTIMNTINSSVSGSGPKFATFVTDVVGDVHGDIMLYPMLLAAMLQAATTPSKSTIAVNNDSTITNNVNLKATSGNAAVTDNTTAGNATSGTANTVANVMNIINSIIAANQSFVGTVNIYGNLDGDILVAPDFLPQLLASNTGASSAPTNSLAVSSQDTQAIMNNINLNAASGSATVADNTKAGNATTGSAATNLVLLNLSGHQIVANNSLLVFVNVLGQWVGLIVDAPSGATAAALGNGVTKNNVAPDLTINVNNNSKIVNNINLDSQTGNATVADNTKAGNATSGKATASANVANISGSQLGLTGWFGVLFINVFGNWFGSFGIDTARGNQPATHGGSTSHPANSSGASSQPFQFVAKDTPAAVARNHSPYFAANNTSEPPATTDGPETQASTQGATTKYTPPKASSRSTQAQSEIDFLPFVAVTFVLGLGGIATRNIIGVIRGRGRMIL